MKISTAKKITWLHAARDLAAKAECSAEDLIAAEIVAGQRQDGAEEIIVTCEDLRRAVRTRAQEGA